LKTPFKKTLICGNALPQITLDLAIRPKNEPAFFEMRLNVTVAPEILEGVLGHRLAADLEELGILWRPGEIRSIFFLMKSCTKPHKKARCCQFLLG